MNNRSRLCNKGARVLSHSRLATIEALELHLRTSVSQNFSFALQVSLPFLFFCLHSFHLYSRRFYTILFSFIARLLSVFVCTLFFTCSHPSKYFLSRRPTTYETSLRSLYRYMLQCNARSLSKAAVCCY